MCLGVCVLGFCERKMLHIFVDFCKFLARMHVAFHLETLLVAFNVEFISCQTPAACVA
jgi:hypothetical protein